MGTKKTVLYLLVVLITTTNLKCECNKVVGCAENVYSFEIGVKAYPDIDSISVGDTIWVEIDNSVMLSDINSNKLIDYSNADNLGTSISFAKLISPDNVITETANLFTYKIVTGSEVLSLDSTKFREYIFAEINNRYMFKLGIIPTTKGVFKLFISNAANVFTCCSLK